MSTVEERVRQIVIKELDLKEEDVKLTSKFVDDLGADSLNIVEIMMKLEEEFGGIEIPDEDAEKIATIKDAVEYISEHISE